MKIHAHILAPSTQDQLSWKTQIQSGLKLSDTVELKFGSLEDAQIVFVDSVVSKADLLSLRQPGRAIFLLARPTAPTEEILCALDEGSVDDVLLSPLRPLEVLSKLRLFQNLSMWDEVTHVSRSFGEILHHLRDDVQLAERLQQAKFPLRFPDIDGLGVTHRYLAGMKSGGDHFDIAESRDRKTVSLVLTDSSSYGLSGQVLSVLMRVALKLSAEESRSAARLVECVKSEILLTLKDNDRLSLFIGVLDRKTYRLEYVSLGSSYALYAPPGRPFDFLPSQGESISRPAKEQVPSASVTLEAGGRLALLSDGVVDASGGASLVLDVLNETRSNSPKQTINELSFLAKRELGKNGEEELPPQDFTAVMIDLGLAAPVARLKPKQDATGTSGAF